MWKCHKCAKPVYFAERKQSLGYNWHPECLRCEECGKRLNPGQHAEHKGVPYCHVPCYGALFGPQLFGHGTRVESHKSFGLQKDVPKVGNGPSLPRSHLESKLKVYNQFFEGKSGEIRSREVNNRLILEGSLRIYWGVQGVIHLKENDDTRTVVTIRKRNSQRYSSADQDNPDGLERDPDCSDDDVESLSRDTSCQDISSCSSIGGGGGAEDRDASSSTTLSLPLDSTDGASDNPQNRSDTGIESGSDSTDISTAENSPTTPTKDPLSISPPSSSSMIALVPLPKSVTLPSKLDVKNLEWDELDELLQVERRHDDSDKLYQTMPPVIPLPQQQHLQSNDVSQGSAGDKTNDSSSSVQLAYDNDDTYNNSDSTKTDSPSDKTENTTNSSSSPTTEGPDTTTTPTIQNDSTVATATELTETLRNPLTKSLENGPDNSSNKQISTPSESSQNKDKDTQSPLKQPQQSTNKNNNEKNYNKDSKEKQAMITSKDDSWVMNSNSLNRSMSGPDCLVRIRDHPHSPEFDRSSMTGDSSHMDMSVMSEALGDVVIRRPAKTGSTAIRRRPGKRLSRTKVKRRCSINGHFYDRETSFFTPPHGSPSSVWVTSLVSTQEVIHLILEKYKVDSDASNFALFVVRDNGEQRRLKEDEYPLLTRVLLGPHEDVAKLFLMDGHNTPEVSSEVAQFLNLSLVECRSILSQYYSQEEREVARIKERYLEMRRCLLYRMDELKAGL